jgi:microcystin-dependent protein
MPAHSHARQASSKVASESDATGRVPATLPAGKPLAYGTDKPYATIDPSAIGSAGGGSAHNNIQPYLAVTFIICTNGTFPPPG